MQSLFNTLIQTTQEVPWQRVSSFGVGAAPEATSGKAPVGKSRVDTGTCPFRQPHGQAWVTTECQCQKSKEENKTQVNEKEGKAVNTERAIYFSADPFQNLFWLKRLTLNSSLIYGTYLNNLNRRSRAHQIAVGLLFPVWCLISLKDHSPKAYTAAELKG